jgi:hypothetical protein
MHARQRGGFKPTAAIPVLNGEPKVGQKRNSESFCGERAVLVYRLVSAYYTENEHCSASTPDCIDNRKSHGQGQECWTGFQYCYRDRAYQQNYEARSEDRQGTRPDQAFELKRLYRVIRWCEANQQREKPKSRVHGSSILQLFWVWDRGHARAASRDALASIDDERLAETVRVTPEISKPLLSALRGRGLMNHLIHHRDQLILYLRILNVPVPGLYGPSADENL